MKNNKGVSIAILLVIFLFLYGGATYLFYLLMKPSIDVKEKEMTSEQIIDSLAARYDLNLDSLRQNKDFIAALKSKITQEDINERVYLYDDDDVLTKLKEMDSTITDTTTLFITDSLRAIVAKKELLEEQFDKYLDNNKEKFELKYKLKMEAQKNQELLSKIDTLSNMKIEKSSNLDNNKEKLEELRKINQELLEKTQELSGKNLAALVKKYESMKPLKAARILFDMPDPDVVKILKKMNNRQAGKILASLPPSKAASLSIMIMLEDKLNIDTNSSNPKEVLTKGKLL